MIPQITCGQISQIPICFAQKNAPGDHSGRVTHQTTEQIFEGLLLPEFDSKHSLFFADAPFDAHLPGWLKRVISRLKFF